jgi:hypothetical protein
MSRPGGGGGGKETGVGRSPAAVIVVRSCRRPWSARRCRGPAAEVWRAAADPVVVGRPGGYGRGGGRPAAEVLPAAVVAIGRQLDNFSAGLAPAAAVAAVRLPGAPLGRRAADDFA